MDEEETELMQIRGKGITASVGKLKRRQGNKVRRDY